MKVKKRKQNGNFLGEESDEGPIQRLVYSDPSTFATLHAIVQDFDKNEEWDVLDLPPIFFHGGTLPQHREGTIQRLIQKLERLHPESSMAMTPKFGEQQNNVVITLAKELKSGEAPALTRPQIWEHFKTATKRFRATGEGGAGDDWNGAFPEVVFSNLTEEASLEFAILAELCDLCLLASGGKAVLKRLSTSQLDDPSKDVAWIWKEPKEGPERRYRDAMRSLVTELDLPHLTLSALDDTTAALISKQANILTLKTVPLYTRTGRSVLVYRDSDPVSLIARNIVHAPLILDNRIPEHEDIVPRVIELFLASLPAHNVNKPVRPIYLADLPDSTIQTLLKRFGDSTGVTLTISGGRAKLEKSFWSASPDHQGPTTSNEKSLEVAIEALKGFAIDAGRNEIVLGPLPLQSREAVYVEADRLGLAAVGEAGVERDRIVRVVKKGFPSESRQGKVTNQYVSNVVKRFSEGKTVEQRPKASYLIE